MDSVWWLFVGETEILCGRGALKACLDGGAGIYVWQREQTQLPLMYFVGSLSLLSRKPRVPLCGGVTEEEKFCDFLT